MADAKSLKRQYKRNLRQAYSAGRLTDEQVERLHAIGFYPENPVSDNQVVVCYETGEEFPTAHAAARRYHLSANTIYLSINRGYSAGGFHWYYKSNGRPDISTLKPMKTRKVVCEETGEVFDSITDAAETYGVGSISQILKNGGALHGRFHFRYEDAACSAEAETREPANKKRKRKYRKMRPVVNLETGERFDSVSAAASATGFSTGSFYCALNNKSRTVGGFHWKYADDCIQGEEERL